MFDSLQRSTLTANVKLAAQIDRRALAIRQIQNVSLRPDELRAIGGKAERLVRPQSYVLHHPTLPRLGPVPHVQRVPPVLIRDLRPKFDRLLPAGANHDWRIIGAGEAN